MKPLSSSRLATMIAAIVIGSLVATWAAGRVRSDYSQAREDSEASARLTDKMATVCLSRFLLDMPNDAQIDLGSATIDGIDLVAFKKTREEFHQRLADREARIAILTDRLGGNKNLESASTVSRDNALVGKAFVHSRTVTNGTERDVAHPHVVLKMITGSGPHGAVPSSVSEGTAIALWDRVVPTFRLLAKEPRLCAGPNRGTVTGAPQPELQTGAQLGPGAR